MTIDTSRPVLVTGATGYVAGHVVRRLLEEGLTVHATVRDPRDVAEAHLRGAFVPEASGRNIISGQDSGFLEIASILRERFPNHPIPSSKIPKWLLWLVGPLVNPALTRRFVSRNMGLPWKADNRKSVRELGMSYRPLQTTIVEHFQQLVDAGLVEST